MGVVFCVVTVVEEQPVVDATVVAGGAADVFVVAVDGTQQESERESGEERRDQEPGREHREAGDEPHAGEKLGTQLAIEAE